jgi:hypothetical protein
MLFCPDGVVVGEFLTETAKLLRVSAFSIKKKKKKKQGRLDTKPFLFLFL